MQPFQLLVKPAAGDCNLACEYCFYRRTTPELYPEEGRPRMEVETMQRMVSDILSHRFSETIFCWQGGEPTLMGLNFFEQVVKAQMDAGKGGQTVGNALQTNGIVMDAEWAEFLARYNFVVGLSLDGPREIHDRYRKNMGGAPTFDRVMDAAELLSRYGVAFNILSVVNRFNQDKGREVYRFLTGQGFDYIQFIPCLETDPESGEITDFSATPEGLARFYEDVFDEYRKTGFPRVSERTFDALMHMHVTGAPGVCTWQKRCGSYLVVEHNGDVYPCDFFVRDEWKLGNIHEKRLAEFFKHPLMQKFAAAKEDVPDECGACSWTSWCHGGCLKDRVPHGPHQTGRTHFCEAYKKLFDTTREDMEKWATDAGPVPTPSATTTEKPKRNDPCPCGSGKKYKKCCGA